MLCLLRLTLGHQASVIVWIEGRHPEIFNFASAYDALLFERLIATQIEFITHGANRLIPVEKE